MEGERRPLLHADSSRQLDNRSEEEEDEEVEEEQEEDSPIGPPTTSSCSQWRPQLVGIELAGCLHSFSSGLHEVSQSLSSNMFHLHLG